MPTQPAKRVEAEQLERQDEVAASQRDENAMDGLLGDIAPEGGEGEATTEGAQATQLSSAATGNQQPPADDKTKEDETKPKPVEDGKAQETDEDKNKRLDAELEAELKERIKDIAEPDKNAPKHVKDALKAMKGKLKENLKELRLEKEGKALSQKERDELRERLQKIGDVDPEKVNEWKQLERSVLAEKDPEFVSSFIEPANQANAAALDVLKGFKLPDTVAQWIEGEGGVLAFYQSNKPSGVNGANGKPILVNGRPQTQSEWFEVNILNNPSLTVGQREEIRDAITSARTAAKSRDKALTDLKGVRGEFVNKQAEKDQKVAEQLVKTYDATIDEVATTLGKMAQIWESKPDATAEEKQIVEEHNERLKVAVSRVNAIKELLKGGDFKSPTFAQHLGRIAITAANAEYLASANKKLADKLDAAVKRAEEAEGKLDKIKGARHTRDMNNAPPSNQEKSKAPSGASDEQAMDELMDQLP